MRTTVITLAFVCGGSAVHAQTCFTRTFPSGASVTECPSTMPAIPPVEGIVRQAPAAGSTMPPLSDIPPAPGLRYVCRTSVAECALPVISGIVAGSLCNCQGLTGNVE